MKVEPARLTLKEALRRKFGTPKNVLRALQLPESLLDIRGMALDGAMPGGMTSKVMLDKLLAQHLSGHALQQARDLLNSIDPDDGERTDPFEEGAVDEDDDDETKRASRRDMMMRAADVLAKKGFDEKEIFDVLREFPSNGLENLGGALAEDLRKVMSVMSDRRRRTGHDEKRRQLAADRANSSLLEFFPEAARLNGTALEAGIGAAPQIAVDFDRFIRRDVS